MKRDFLRTAALSALVLAATFGGHALLAWIA